MHRYIPNTEADLTCMLDRLGLSSIDELFRDIPRELLLENGLDLPEALSEQELISKMMGLSKKNSGVNELTCFLGAGAYDHFIPVVVGELVSRSEFYTSYTPYQPEISQGTLQAIFEYQTMICNLTGMDSTNASMYDGPTACAEAARMAVDSTRRNTIAVSRTVNPEVRKVLDTYMDLCGFKIVEIGMDNGATDISQLEEQLNDDLAAVVVQSPNFFGIIEDMNAVGELLSGSKTLFISYVNPISLAVLKKPGEYGADIAVGEGQSLGNSLNFGGPYVGFLATTKKLMRKMPGRIVGQTTDVDGKRAFVLTLQAREQHIRRSKASSNICSNQGLNALASAIYMATMGESGLKEVATQCMQKAHYAQKKLTENGVYKPLFDRPFFMEFAVTSAVDPSSVNRDLLEAGILGGYQLSREYDEYTNGLLLCVTEKRTKAEIDKLVDCMLETAAKEGRGMA
ncbi:MAG: aminomethyl-transferring glycine dehydrogenase subunit GcvPA [Clostridiales bacterium]|jgi:glycine dehydrogenase subunit 1|nr:aminomethyl-transferring glycine dehydrogenase subunit GcvPA [Clostridiales bacterium]